MLHNMLFLLQQPCPSDLMPLLAEHSQGSLQEAIDAFPAKACVISTNLQLLVTAVEGICTPFFQTRITSHLYYT